MLHGSRHAFTANFRKCIYQNLFHCLLPIVPTPIGNFLTFKFYQPVPLLQETSLYKLVLIKKRLLTWYFFGWFLFEAKTKQIFSMLSFWHVFSFWRLCQLDLRDLNVRNFKFTFEKSKHLNSVMSIFLNSLASVLTEFPTRNLQKITELHVCILSIL